MMDVVEPMINQNAAAFIDRISFKEFDLGDIVIDLAFLIKYN